MVHPPRSFSRIRAGTLCIFGLVHSRCGHGSPVGGPVESTRTLGPRGSTACTYEKHMRHKSHCFPGLIRVSRWEPACGVGSTALYMAGISTYPFPDGKTRIKKSYSKQWSCIIGGPPLYMGGLYGWAVQNAHRTCEPGPGPP